MGKTHLDIAIVGGGVCGLACAVTLKKYGVKADIYEAAVRLSIPCILHPEYSN